MKKAVGNQGVKIFQDRFGLDGLEDYESAISHIKYSKTSLDMANLVINPAIVHFLFIRMLDEVWTLKLSGNNKLFLVGCSSLYTFFNQRRKKWDV